MKFLLKIILTPLFFIILTPVALLMRLAGKDLINKNLNKQKISYWQSVDKESLPTSRISPNNQN